MRVLWWQLPIGGDTSAPLFWNARRLMEGTVVYYDISIILYSLSFRIFMSLFSFHCISRDLVPTGWIPACIEQYRCTKDVTSRGDCCAMPMCEQYRNWWRVVVMYEQRDIQWTLNMARESHCWIIALFYSIDDIFIISLNDVKNLQYSCLLRD